MKSWISRSCHSIHKMQLMMHLAISLRKPKYNSLNRVFDCFFTLQEVQTNSFIFLFHHPWHVYSSSSCRLWWVGGCWSWWINGIASLGIMSTFKKEWLGKCQTLSQPHLYFFIIRTKLFQHHPMQSWDRQHPSSRDAWKFGSSVVIAELDQSCFIACF